MKKKKEKEKKKQTSELGELVVCHGHDEVLQFSVVSQSMSSHDEIVKVAS